MKASDFTSTINTVFSAQPKYCQESEPPGMGMVEWNTGMEYWNDLFHSTDS